VYNERFKFMAHDPFGCLVFTVEDIDAMSGPDFIGNCYVPLTELVDGKPFVLDTTLFNAMSNVDPTCGRLIVRVQWVHNPKPKAEWGYTNEDNEHMSVLDKVMCTLEADSGCSMYAGAKLRTKGPKFLFRVDHLVIRRVTINIAKLFDNSETAGTGGSAMQLRLAHLTWEPHELRPPEGREGVTMTELKVMIVHAVLYDSA
jgi:hypothetical protein